MVRLAEFLLGPGIRVLVNIDAFSSIFTGSTPSNAQNQQAPPPPPKAEIDYLQKPDYGQMPAYLAAVKVRDLNHI